MPVLGGRSRYVILFACREYSLVEATKRTPLASPFSLSCPAFGLCSALLPALLQAKGSSAITLDIRLVVVLYVLGE